MTINEYLDGLPNMTNRKTGSTLRDMMSDTVSVWSNDACNGYVIQALTDLNYNRADINAVLLALRNCYSDYSVDDAEQIYQEF